MLTSKRTLTACLFALAAILPSGVFGLNIRPDREQSKYAEYGKQYSAACAIAWDQSKVIIDGKGLVPIPLYRGNDEAGRTATIVGFGGLGNFATGAPNARDAIKQPLVRRAGTNVVEKVWIGDRCLTQVSRLDDATDLEAGVLGGDSGGPLLIQDNGQWFLAGVTKASIGGGMEPVHPSYGDNGFVFYPVTDPNCLLPLQRRST
jgi:hypothetical protein